MLTVTFPASTAADHGLAAAAYMMLRSALASYREPGGTEPDWALWAGILAAVDALSANTTFGMVGPLSSAGGALELSDDEQAAVTAAWTSYRARIVEVGQARQVVWINTALGVAA